MPDTKHSNHHHGMTTIHFTKMHGAGNDYIYVDTDRYPIADPSEAAKLWSQHHFSIGSDGLVLISKVDGQNPEEAHDRMRIFNADGSEAMMCGNASRCIGKYLYDKGLTHHTTIYLHTLSGIKILELHLAEDGTVDKVTVDMGTPEELHAQPHHHPEELPTPGIHLSMGNPHYVSFLNDSPSSPETHTLSDADLTRIGSALEHDPAWPDGCNIEIAWLTAPNTIRMRVWERGSGITLACGTGACATAVASIISARCRRELPVNIDMDGGTLHIEYRSNGHVMMTGPARFAYEGDINI